MRVSLVTLEDELVAIHVAPEKRHGSHAYDLLYLRLKDLANERKLLLCFDKAYFRYERLDKMCGEGVLFVTPKNRYSLNRVDNRPLVRSQAGDWLVEERHFKHQGMDHRLRWILASKGEEEYELLTNLWDLPALRVMELYRLRWRLEVLFKEAKQLLGLKTPG